MGSQNTCVDCGGRCYGKLRCRPCQNLHVATDTPHYTPCVDCGVDCRGERCMACRTAHRQTGSSGRVCALEGCSKPARGLLGVYCSRACNNADRLRRCVDCGGECSRYAKRCPNCASKAKAMYGMGDCVCGRRFVKRAPMAIWCELCRQEKTEYERMKYRRIQKRLARNGVG